MAKRSPGPWSYYTAPLRKDFPSIIHEIHDRNGVEVVTWGGFDSGGQQQKKLIGANCLLMAAAPELLEAVEAALPFLTEFAAAGNYHAPETVAKMKRAISKATRRARTQSGTNNG